MIYGSVCSGIEAATVAWHGMGWRPSFFSDIEKFPQQVLKHHYPTVPLHGDFTTISENDYESIDLLVGGTPCQDFSVAGLRKGFSGERGNLTLEFIRLAQRLRPRWLVWENVPGVLSIDEGRAFGSFLGGLGECGYGFAYRILDAQHFGVPQRRRRVFVIGYFGDWRPPAEVLFERESLRGDITPSKEKGQNAPTIPSRSSAGGGLGTDFDCDGGLIAHTLRGEGFDASDNGTGNVNLIASTGNIAHCLNAGGMGRQDYETETLIAFSAKDHGSDAMIDLSPTLRAGGHNNSHANAGVMPAVAFNLRGREGGAMPELDDMASMRAASGGSSRSYIATSSVRRLTPRECERLQGFPDDYTRISDKTADGPRYKALGNSMAVPVMKWIGERINAVENRRAA